MSAYTRRDALDLLAWGGAFGLSGARLRARLGQRANLGGGQPADVLLRTAVERNDTAVQALLQTQVTDPSSPFRGSIPDQVGLHSAGSAGGVSETLVASFVHPRSRFHRDTVLFDRIRLAAGFLERSQSPQGNIDLLTTNFNSPPDTGFVVHNVATAAAIGTRHGVPEIAAMLRPFLLKAGEGMAAGGVHTPNHRWVICSALAQVNELFPDARFVRRVDEWLAEGIDVDGDGQYTERSTLTYNIVTNRALIVMAAKLKRPALLDPVRQNLRALMYLLHADGEVVTEISRRQDQFTRGGLAGYWFSLTYMAVTDGDGAFATMAKQAAEGARLSALLEYPELSQQLPAAQALPTDYERTFSDVGIARLRRGPLSATLVLGGSSRLFSMRYGDAVIEGVRLATSFFGKGQFVPDTAAKQGGSYVFRQQLQAPYYQPLARTITPETWGPTRSERRQTEINRLEHVAEVTETASGFQVRARAHGTDGVPLALEIAFRSGGRLEGCPAVPGTPGSYLLERGTGSYRSGRNEIRFGPGSAPHRYVQLRGAEPKLPGESVYITGFTPFDRTITFECA
jgi:hypothetical protein